MKKQSQWAANQEKAENMTKKFIAVLKNLDCWDNYAAILMKGICCQMVEDKTNFNNEEIADMIESTFGLRTFESNSIIEDMKIDEFLEDLKANPYQLKLIA
jgi:hypothetical protein